jgi:DNA repair exonuclease SbcCD ATPase subunit
MNNEQLRAQLEELHAELRQASTLGPQQREILQARANEIEQLLKREEIEPHHYGSLRERLSEDVAELEASHPQITLLMRRVIDSLAYLGI